MVFPLFLWFSHGFPTFPWFSKVFPMVFQCHIPEGMSFAPPSVQSLHWIKLPWDQSGIGKPAAPRLTMWTLRVMWAQPVGFIEIQGNWEYIYIYIFVTIFTYNYLYIYIYTYNNCVYIICRYIYIYKPIYIYSETLSLVGFVDFCLSRVHRQTNKRENVNHLRALKSTASSSQAKTTIINQTLPQLNITDQPFH